MRHKLCQIIWHGKEPVFSADFHSSGLLATAGGDKDIKLWNVGLDANGLPEVTHLTSLGCGHNTTVNCVRFSPTGEQLASSADQGEVLLWKVDLDAVHGEETVWQRSLCRGHSEDVQDIAWAPDGSALATCGIDHTTVLWSAAGGPGVARLQDHRHYVQGAAWDPAARFLVTQSSDRTCRVYAPRPPLAGKRGSKAAAAGTCAANLRDLISHKTLSKRPLVSAAAGAQRGEAVTQLMFKDEHMVTFHRRLAWSPDGSFLVIPAGISQTVQGGETVNTTYVYARDHWKAPVAHLPATDAPSVAVRFCPHLFKLRRCDLGGGAPGPNRSSPDSSTAAASVDNASAQPTPDAAPAEASRDAALSGDADEKGGAAAWAALPYRMLFAVATMDSVVIYDTQGMRAVAMLGRIHLDSITDLAWSPCGTYLAVSSRDGFCTLAAFSDGDLGERVPADSLPQHLAVRMAAAAGKLPTRPAAASQPSSAEQRAPGMPQQQQQPEPGTRFDADASARVHTPGLPPAGAQPWPRKVEAQPVSAPRPAGPAAASVQTPAAAHLASATTASPAAAATACTTASPAAPAGLAGSFPMVANGAGQQAASDVAVRHASDPGPSPAAGAAAADASPSSAAKRMRRIQPMPVLAPRAGSTFPAATVLWPESTRVA